MRTHEATWSIWGGFGLFTDAWLAGLVRTGNARKCQLLPNQWSISPLSGRYVERQDATVALCEKLRAKRIAFVPGGLTCASDNLQHPQSQWFDEKWWASIAAGVKALANRTGSKDIQLDFEPYGMDPPYYPPISDVPALRNAMRPLIDVLLAEGIHPWITPGDCPPAYAKWYSPTAVLATALPCTFLSEATYGWPDDPASTTMLGLWRERKRIYEGLGHRYLPGFYGSAWRNPKFQRVLGKNEIKSLWLFFRAIDDFDAMWRT